MNENIEFKDKLCELADETHAEYMDEIRKLKGKRAFCEWRLSEKANVVWSTSCSHHPDALYDEWTYCPYCSMEIKEPSTGTGQ